MSYSNTLPADTLTPPSDLAIDFARYTKQYLQEMELLTLEVQQSTAI